MRWLGAHDQAKPDVEYTAEPRKWLEVEKTGRIKKQKSERRVLPRRQRLARGGSSCSGLACACRSRMQGLFFLEA